MDSKKLIDKILKYDSDGEIIIELITQKVLTIKDIIKYGILSFDIDFIIKLIELSNEEEFAVIEEEIIKNKTIEDLYQFALNVEKCNISKIETELLKREFNPTIIEFAAQFKEINIDLFENKIIEIEQESSRLHWLIIFARDVENANINKLCDYIIKAMDPHYIFLFALCVSNADVEKLGNALVNTNNDYYTCRFLIRLGYKISKELRKKLLNVLIENNNYQYIEELFLETNDISLFEYKEALSIIKKRKNKKLIKKLNKFNI